MARIEKGASMWYIVARECAMNAPPFCVSL